MMSRIDELSKRAEVVGSGPEDRARHRRRGHPGQRCRRSARDGAGLRDRTRNLCHHHAVLAGRRTADGGAHDRGVFRSSQGESHPTPDRKGARRGRTFLRNHRPHQSRAGCRHLAPGAHVGNAYAVFVGRPGRHAEFHSLRGIGLDPVDPHAGGRGVLRRPRPRHRGVPELPGPRPPSRVSSSSRC